MRVFRWLVLSLFLIVSVNVLTGCNTLADARMAKGSGIYKVYNSPSEEVWDAVKKAIEATELKYVGENREENYILAQRGMTMFSYGENVAIFIESIDATKTRVEIVSKRSMSTNVLAPNWSKKLFEKLNTMLKPIESMETER